MIKLQLEKPENKVSLYGAGTKNNTVKKVQCCGYTFLITRHCNIYAIWGFIIVLLIFLINTTLFLLAVGPLA